MLQNSLLRGALAALLFTLAACGAPSNDAASGASAAGTAGNATNSSSSTSNSSARIALSSSNYTVAATSPVALVTVNRAGSSTGQASVSYTTVSGTAIAGTDYGQTSGSLTWNDGDTSSK